MSFCSCRSACRSREEMRLRHGTPKQFGVAVYRAVPGFVSLDEANAAIDQYAREYDAAPETAEHDLQPAGASDASSHE